jgi:hypothetical protein
MLTNVLGYLEGLGLHPCIGNERVETMKFRANSLAEAQDAIVRAEIKVPHFKLRVLPALCLVLYLFHGCFAFLNVSTGENDL